jgi:hypothetical protein
MQTNSLVLIIIVVLVGGAWMEREKVKKYWQAQFHPQTETPQTTVYTWKDSEGTIHYASHADDKKAKEMVVDTRKISRLEPLPPPKETKKEQDKLLIMEMREELIRNRDKMQKAKEKQIMDE